MRSQAVGWAIAVLAILVPTSIWLAWTKIDAIVYPLAVSVILGLLLGVTSSARDWVVAGAITGVWLAYTGFLIAMPPGELDREPIPDRYAAAWAAMWALPIMGGSFVGVRLGRVGRR